MISCGDAVRQLWQYLEDALDDVERAQVEEHLGLCMRCCGEVEFAQELRGFLVRHGSETLPDDVRERLTAFMEGIER